MTYGWRAYYADGRTFGSGDVEWSALPPTGLVGVVVFLDPPYRRIIDGFDWIYMADGELHTVMTHDTWGEWADRPDVPCDSCVKQGAGMDDDAWDAIQRRMFNDREWP